MLRKFKKLLITPLIYGVALVLLFEQWLWHTSRRILARFPLFAIIARLEAWISSLSPYAALAIFVAPSLLLIPVKVLALLSMTHGHPTTGVLIVLLAKVAGTALVARLYSLTERSLSTLSWFVRWRDALLKAGPLAQSGAQMDVATRPQISRVGRPQQARLIRLILCRQLVACPCWRKYCCPIQRPAFPVRRTRQP